jgi:betaine-homocysteine S-methyltransferase
MPKTQNRFLKRLKKGPLICAEGYLFEMERRGYLQAGAFVPLVVLEHPEVVEQLHREFVRTDFIIAETLGRTPEASQYSADMSKHAFLGKDKKLKKEYFEYKKDL